MLHINEQELYDAFDAAPPHVAEYVIGDDINQKVATLGKIHHISLERFVTLKNILVYLSLKLIPQEMLGELLVEECGASPDDVDVFIAEVFSILGDAGVMTLHTTGEIKQLVPESTSQAGTPSLDELRAGQTDINTPEIHLITPETTESSVPTIEVLTPTIPTTSPASVTPVPTPTTATDIPRYAMSQIPADTPVHTLPPEMVDLQLAYNTTIANSTQPVSHMQGVISTFSQDVATTSKRPPSDIPSHEAIAGESPHEKASSAQSVQPTVTPRTQPKNASGTQLSLMDKLSLIQKMPNEDAIEERLRKISEYSNQEIAKDIETSETSQAVPIMPATARPVPTEKPPDKYSVDPYREIPAPEDE